MRCRCRAEIAIVLDLADKRALSIQTLEAELARCRNLPPAKADDPACQELWANQRLRFLAPGKTFDGAGKPLDMFPSVPNAREQAAPASSPTSKGE